MEALHKGWLEFLNIQMWSEREKTRKWQIFWSLCLLEQCDHRERKKLLTIPECRGRANENCTPSPGDVISRSSSPEVLGRLFSLAAKLLGVIHQLKVFFESVQAGAAEAESLWCVFTGLCYKCALGLCSPSLTCGTGNPSPGTALSTTCSVDNNPEGSESWQERPCCSPGTRAVMDGWRSSQKMPCPELLAEHLPELLPQCWAHTPAGWPCSRCWLGLFGRFWVQILSHSPLAWALQRPQQGCSVMLINGEGDGATLGECSELRAPTDRLCCAVLQTKFTADGFGAACTGRSRSGCRAAQVWKSIYPKGLTSKSGEKGLNQLKLKSASFRCDLWFQNRTGGAPYWSKYWHEKPVQGGRKVLSLVWSFNSNFCHAPPIKCANMVPKGTTESSASSLFFVRGSTEEK